MYRKMKCFILIALLFALISGDAMAADAGADVLKRIHSYRALWESPPEVTPADHSVDGPLMGNGDMGVALGGQPEALRFHLCKNDFWRLESKFGDGGKYGRSGPRVFGYLDITSQVLKGAEYHVEQLIANGVTTGTFKKGGLSVQVKSFVAATENVFIVEVSSQGGDADIQVSLTADKGGDSDSAVGQQGSIAWAVRKFEKDIDIPTEAAAAMTVVGATDKAFILKPGQKVVLAVCMESRFKYNKPLDTVIKKASGIDLHAVEQLEKEHQQWWSSYWSKSWVEIDDPELEKGYYQSLYTMGAASRDPKFPPAMFGWVTTDRPKWAGDYHLNYNHYAPFYALYSANRIEQGDPQDAPILDFRKRGKWYAENVTKTRGVLYSVGVGPLGIETSFERRLGNPNSLNKEKGGLFWRQRSNAAYSLVNIAQRWRTTYDPVYGQKVYPLVKDVAEFWEDYLKFEDGRYMIYGDAIHEGGGGHDEDVNSILSLGLIRNALDLAIDISSEMGIDADKRVKWQYIIDHLSGFPTQEKESKTVFRYTEKGTAWWKGNTLGIQHIYPGNTIGLDSDAALLKVARATIAVMHRWRDFNGTNSFYPAAARLGYDPVALLQKLQAYCRDKYPNGLKKGNPHGIENCSTVPNTINMMLCMSHVPVGNAYLQGETRSQTKPRSESVIRLFPVWPKEKDARFEKIRCWGAFLVSSDLKDGQVQYVKLYSERGRDCTMVNPWPGENVTVYRNGKAIKKLSGERFTFKTSKEETLILGPTDVPFKELEQPASLRFDLSQNEFWGDTTEEQRLERLKTVREPRGEKNPLPVRKRTVEEQEQLVKKLDWFYKAKYGVMVHYLAGISGSSTIQWTPEEWDAWVDAVDVNAFADQCAEAGAGYVLLTIGQQRNYYCSVRNPVYEDLWGFEPGRYSSKRDLPMDLYKALEKRGIRMMLYVTGSPFATQGDAEKKSEEVGWKWDPSPSERAATWEASEKWCKAIEWWSQHYSKACSGWWVDGNFNFVSGHALRIDKALRSGNPETIIGTSYLALSDYSHGHCVRNWSEQQLHIPPQGPDCHGGWNLYSLDYLEQPISPEDGRWIPLYNNQWHALQFLGERWARSDTNKTTQSVVEYSRKVISRGGVITFDIGVYGAEGANGKKAPYLKIQDGQFEQLCAIRDAVEGIKR